MNLRNATLTVAVAAALGLAPDAGLAQDGGASPIKWYGSIYAKFLDGNRRTEAGLYSNAETTPGEGGGDQGQGIEFELLFNAQVSKQVEIGGRLHSRFNKNFWANYGGFAVPDNNTTNCGEDDPRCNQYVKLRGAWARITPGLRVDGLGVHRQQRLGHVRRVDPGQVALHRPRQHRRRAAAGLGARQEAALGSRARQPGELPGRRVQHRHVRRGHLRQRRELDRPGQVRAEPRLECDADRLYARDKEVEDDDPNTLNGVGAKTAFDNAVIAVKGQYTGLDFMDVSGAYYHTNFNVDDTLCGGGLNGPCRFSPLPLRSMNDDSFYLNVNFNELFIDGLSLGVQYFDIGSDFASVASARREQDVLLTEGQEGTWQWGRPDYNFGNRSNANSMAGLGWGGWNGEVQQVVSGAADNDFTDFDEPVAFSVIGWKGITLVPKYAIGDWEFAGEYSYIDFNTNWQACGGTDKDIDCQAYPRNEGVNSWALGGAYRSPYSPFQDRTMEIFALRAMYTLDVGKGVDLMARYKYISDEDDRVTRASSLTDAYDGFPAATGAINPDWIPNIGLGGCLSCDDRRADYDTYGFSAGYQLTPDLYAKLIYEFHTVELIDGTIDVAPVGLGFEASNDFGFAEYVTGESEKNRLGLDFSYFLSGVEFGGTIDYLWGTYDPEFYTDSSGRRVKLVAAPGVTSFATPLGNIPLSTVDYGQYRMKVFMKVSF